MLFFLASAEALPSGAVSKSGALERLQSWQKETLSRQDLEDRERDLRVHFVSRLIFQVERKYKETDFTKFLTNSLERMAETDSLQSNQSYGSMSLFFTNMATAINELMERKENHIDFMRSFTEFSGISDPSTLEEFSETRQYYDGVGMYKATPLNLDEAANWVDDRERALLSQPDLLKFDKNLQEELRIEKLEMDEDIQIEIKPADSSSASPEVASTQGSETASDLTLQNSSNPNLESSRP